jgi:FlaA1/EpsC-like NDP-sugar epimerase
MIKKMSISSLIKKIKIQIFGTSRKSKRIIVLLIDVFLLIFTVWLSLSLRYEEIHSLKSSESIAYIAALLIGIPIFIYSGFYRLIYRYSGFIAIKSIAKACVQYGIIYFIIVAIIVPKGLPRSIGIMQPILLLLSLAWSRAVARFIFHPENAINKTKFIKERYLIYGAGSAGVQIATALMHNPKYSVEGFIDDDTAIVGQNINGIVVFGVDDVAETVKRKMISTILIAIPSATRTTKQSIYKKYEGLGVHICTLPSIDVIANGKISLSDIREIDIDDLLGRDPVTPYPELFSKCIRNKKVMVTGAGGSIGSEICRQIIIQDPETLILFEKSEFNLYQISKELNDKIKTMKKKCSIISILGDVTDNKYIDKVCKKYQPFTIYHTAAYKHVPLVEENPFAGIWNNIFGTFYTAEAARRNNVGYMVLISTDKAVRPTSIMGASKRVSELVLQGLSEEKYRNNTCFSIVRFGNVLGSSGSVVPLFKNQINKGGPITVTHNDVTRYFMTIPEAAQLVIQAGAMAEGGDVFLLDMGIPVRIYDLAVRMVELSGLKIKTKDKPEGDIEIEITGLRPGEKLYEELLITDNPIKTQHPRIYKAHEKYLQFNELERKLEDIKYLIQNNEEDIEKMKLIMKELVSGF